MPARKKPVARKAPPDTKTQKERFIEAARSVGASERADDFERAFMTVITPKTKSSKTAKG